MSELVQEFFDSRGLALRVDRQAGVIRGIKVLGPHSRNGREYLPAALGRAVGLYEGAKVNVNHPKGNPLAPRDYEERIGVIRNVQHKSGEGLFADLHFNPKHSLSEQLMWDAEHAPENVGFSHNVNARTSRKGETTLVEEILQVHGVDLVADPATTRGLFEGVAAPAACEGAATTDSVSGGVLEPAVAMADDSGAPVSEQQANLLEKLCQEQGAEIASLRLEVDQLRAKEAASARQATVRALLAEYGLPEPDGSDATSQAIVSETFMQSLLAAGDETAMRRLVEERARLVGNTALGHSGAGARHYSPSLRRPVSRDQSLVDLPRVSDGKSFARAIVG